MIVCYSVPYDALGLRKLRAWELLHELHCPTFYALGGVGSSSTPSHAVDLTSVQAGVSGLSFLAAKFGTPNMAFYPGNHSFEQRILTCSLISVPHFFTPIQIFPTTILMCVNLEGLNFPGF